MKPTPAPKGHNTYINRAQTVHPLRALRSGLVYGLLALAGCVETDAVTEIGYRDQSAIIAATTRFDPIRFSGDWQVRERFAEIPKTQGFKFDLMVKGGTALWHFATVSAPYKVSIERPGVIEMTGPKGTKQSLVVLWVNEEFTVAALGTFKGERGYIITKRGRGQAGTVTAAREILSFNGYDISKLKRSK